MSFSPHLLPPSLPPFLPHGDQSRSESEIRGDLPAPLLVSLLPPECTCQRFITIGIKLQPAIITSCFRTSSSSYLVNRSLTRSLTLWRCGVENTRGEDQLVTCSENRFKKITSVFVCPSGRRHPQQPGCPVREEREVQGSRAAVQESAGDQRKGGSKVKQ